MNGRWGRVLERVYELFETAEVLPFPSVQYAMSEVGSPRSRIDALELLTALELGSRPALRKSELPKIHQPRPHVYTGGHLTHRGDSSRASILASAKQEQLDRFSYTHSFPRSTDVAEAISSELEGELNMMQCDAGAVETLGAEVHWPAEGTVVTATDNAGSKKSIWITMNIHWIYPHAPALWRHLYECASNRTRPIVVARKIAFATFPLLKALGGYGIQLHHMYLPSKPSERELRGAFPFFPVVAATNDLEDHPALAQLLEEIQIQTDPIDIRTDTEVAIEAGLADAKMATASALRGWADRARAVLPRPWKAQITRFAEWETLRAGAAVR